MARQKKYTPKAFREACGAYFRRRSYETTVRSLEPTGRTNAKGLPVMDYVPVKNGDGELIKVLEYAAPPSVESLCVELGISRATFANYAQDERYKGACEAVKLRIEAYLHRQLNERQKGTDGIIFDLKVNHGWRDNADVDVDRKIEISFGEEDYTD